MDWSWGPKLICSNDNRPKDWEVNNRSDLLGIGSEYAALELRLRLLMEHQRRTWPGSAWTEELEKQWSRKLDPIRDRMAELRWKAVDLPATNLRELKAKAMILLETTDDNPNHVSSQLAISLCHDLIQFATMHLPDRDQNLERRSLSREEPVTAD